MPQRPFTWANGLTLAAALLFTLFPLFWLFSTSFKPWQELVTTWVPSEISLRNYRDVFYPYVNMAGMPESSS